MTMKKLFMLHLKKVVAVATVSMMLTGCGLYNKYDNKTQTPENVFGTSQLDATPDATSESIASMS